MIVQPAAGRPRKGRIGIHRAAARPSALRPEVRAATLPPLPRAHIHRLYAGLFAADALLITLNVLLVAGVRTESEFLNRQADLAHEANLAAWYSSSLLLLAGVIAWILAWTSSMSGALPVWPRRLRIGAWLLTGGMLLALAADEVSQMHEWLGNRVPHHVGAGETVLGLSMAFRWLLVLAPLIAGGAAFLVWFAWKCLRGGPRLLVFAGVACWLGTIAAEYVESVQWSAGYARGMQAPIEEGLEVLGTTLILVAFIEVLSDTLRRALGAESREQPVLVHVVQSESPASRAH